MLLENAFEMHNMALEAVDKVVNDPVLLKMFNIQPQLQEAVKKSWLDGQTDLQGRFDYSWGLTLDRPDDPLLPVSGQYWEPKMLEYNADTPSL